MQFVKSLHKTYFFIKNHIYSNSITLNHNHTHNHWQTKLGLGGACEALVDIVKILASNKEGGHGLSHDGGVGVLGTIGEAGTPVSGALALALSVTTDDAANAVGTAVDDEAIAKWTVWAIGNMVRLLKIHVLAKSIQENTLTQGTPFLLYMYCVSWKIPRHDSTIARW